MQCELTNQCTRRLGAIRTNVSQNTRLSNRRFFCDVRVDGRGPKEFFKGGEQESGQENGEAPHG